MLTNPERWSIKKLTNPERSVKKIDRPQRLAKKTDRLKRMVKITNPERSVKSSGASREGGAPPIILIIDFDILLNLSGNVGGGGTIIV